MTHEESGLNIFPIDEDNHFIDVLKVFSLSSFADNLVNLDPKIAIEGPEKAAKVVQDFEDFYKGKLKLKELTHLEGFQITFTIKNVFEKFNIKIYSFEIRIIQEINLE